MGWSSGSILFSEIIDIIKRHVDDDETRECLYAEMILEFENMDCDTLDECQGEDPAFDDAFLAAHPELEEEEEEE